MEVTHARLNNIVTHRLIASVVTRVARPRLIDAIVYVHAVAVISLATQRSNRLNLRCFG